MKKIISLLLSLLIILTSIITVAGEASPSIYNVIDNPVIVHPILSTGFMCQNQYIKINFDTGKIFSSNSSVEFDDVIIERNEVLCPAQPFLEELHFTFYYNASESAITATRKDTTMIIFLNENKISVNGVNYTSEHSSRNVEGIQYIPASAILEALGYETIVFGKNANSITYAQNCTTYELWSDGTISISGSAIPDYTETEIKPWDNYTRDIKKLIIEDFVPYVGTYAFNNCVNLTSVNIPNTLKVIEKGAFDNCTSLTDIYYDGSESDWGSIFIGEDNEFLTNATLHFISDDPTKRTVKFNTNGGIGRFSTVSAAKGSDITLPQKSPTRPGHRFIGWAFTPFADTADLVPLDKYIVNESIVLYAIWQSVPHIETTIEKYTDFSSGATYIYNAPSNSTLYIAAYDNYGKLVSLKSIPNCKNTENYTITAKYDTLKIMLWGNSADLKPLCNANNITAFDIIFHIKLQ